MQKKVWVYFLLRIHSESIMIIKKHFLNILRWGLRLHGISHFIEVASAINEEAYITATIAFIFIVIEILASFFIPDEHIHFKPLQSEVHASCAEDADEEIKADKKHTS